MYEISKLAKKAKEISSESEKLAEKLNQIITENAEAAGNVTNDNFVQLFTIFALSCIIGYYIVWRVTPALHTPLMSLTNAVSGIIIIGALMITAFEELNSATFLSAIGIFLASINIFGGFIITWRMLRMFEKK